MTANQTPQSRRRERLTPAVVLVLTVLTFAAMLYGIFGDLP